MQRGMGWSRCQGLVGEKGKVIPLEKRFDRELIREKEKDVDHVERFDNELLPLGVFSRFRFNLHTIHSYIFSLNL
jgi:hypothetical protein